MPAIAAMIAAAAQDSALIRWMLMPRCAASTAFSATPRISIPMVESFSSNGRPSSAATAVMTISASMPLTLTPGSELIGGRAGPTSSAG